MYWPKLTTGEIRSKVFGALNQNLNYRSEKILGVPATYLDTEIFYEDEPFLSNAPFLSMFINNPNHIGCHTLEGEKEPIFTGTQQIEKDLIRICAEEIFQAHPGEYDGYVASGGTEANIEACWIYRNYFMRERNASAEQIAVVYSQDTHYSLPKAANLLALKSLVIPVNDTTRQIHPETLREILTKAVSGGVRYFIVCVNLSTTMFGSVEDVDMIAGTFQELGLEFRLHVDAAFGGFIYPFTNPQSRHHFGNPHVSSVTIDGHKMLQAPYGTGIFLIRKYMMRYVQTPEASYVRGSDCTLSGSRSGANAVCVWMILHAHGSDGWKEKMNTLLALTQNLCTALDEAGVSYFRNPFLNIIAIRSRYVSPDLAHAFCLVPDDHANPAWYKIVMMPHVKKGVLDEFVQLMSGQVQDSGQENLLRRHAKLI